MPVVVKVRDYDECCTTVSYELANYIPEVQDRIQEEEFEQLLYESDDGADGGARYEGGQSQIEERWREVFGEE
jgi:hypothetical protein